MADRSRKQVLALTAVALAVGLAIELISAHFGHMYGDIEALFGSRGIRPHSFPYLDRPLEYPVGIGYVMWATSWVGRNATTFFLANAALASALVFATVSLLQRRNPDRVLRFVVAPTLALYAFHNWDVIPVFCTVAGLIALERRRPVASGLLLAIGAWTKLFPALYIPVLALLMWRDDRRDAMRLVASAAVVSVVVNVPVMLASWTGWMHPVTFQSARRATWGSVWYHVLRLPGMDRLLADTHSVANGLATVTLAVGFVLVARRSLLLRLDPMQVAAALTSLFLLTNKVYSPQYSLWMLPFFVLLPLPRKLWLAFISADLAMYVLIFSHVLRHGSARHALIALIGVTVAIRAAILVAVMIRSLRPPAVSGSVSPPVEPLLGEPVGPALR